MREKLQGKVFLVPSFITVVSIFCGFLSIVSALKGSFDYCAKCIFASIVLDGLDGRIARRLNATSAFGREFDSLADLVAFGVAPAVVVYCWAFKTHIDEFGVLVAFVFVVCGATRLARFNVQSPPPDTDSQQTPALSHFVGLPIPGAAAAVASVVYCSPGYVQSFYFSVLIALYVLLMSALMVCELSFFSIKKLRLTDGNMAVNLAVLSIAVAMAWKYSRFVLPFLSAFYVLSGLLPYLLRKCSSKNV